MRFLYSVKYQKKRSFRHLTMVAILLILIAMRRVGVGTLRVVPPWCQNRCGRMRAPGNVRGVGDVGSIASQRLQCIGARDHCVGTGDGVAVR